MSAIRLVVIADGRKVASEDLVGDALKSALGMGADELPRPIGHVRCPLHGTSANVLRMPAAASELAVMPCCDLLRDAIRQVLTAGSDHLP